MYNLDKIIFLDIDGVLNSEIFSRKQYRRKKFKPIYIYRTLKGKIKFILNGFKYKPTKITIEDSKKWSKFDFRFKRFKESVCKEKMLWLKELCNENNYYIVISSCWKHYFSTVQWNLVFSKFGFNEGTILGITETRRSSRGDEIKDWIDKYGCANYVILDDDSDMLKEQMKHFFWCDNYFGLTPTRCYQIKRFLN